MHEMGVETVLKERDGVTVAEVTVRGRKRLNVVDAPLMDALGTAIAAQHGNATIRCIWLRGAGDHAFIGGADLAALHALDAASAAAFIRTVHRCCAAIRTAPVPVVAVMQGYCLGAGLEIAAACDIRIAAEDVVCGMPEVRVGVPSVVEAALLPGLIGWGRAREWMLRGHLVEAVEAAACGLLQHVVPAPALDELAWRIAHDVAAGAPAAIAAQKRLFLAWEDAGSMSAAIEHGVEAFVAAYADSVPQQAIDAFFAQRARATP